nr:hypothetical protein [Donax semistriatus]
MAVGKLFWRFMFIMVGVLLLMMVMTDNLYAMNEELVAASSAGNAFNSEKFSQFTLSDAMKSMSCWKSVCSANLMVKYWVMFNNGKLEALLNGLTLGCHMPSGSEEYFRFLLEMWVKQAEVVSSQSSSLVLSLWSFCGYSNLMFSVGIPGGSVDMLQTVLFVEVPDDLVSSVSAYSKKVFEMENTKLKVVSEDSVTSSESPDPWVTLISSITSTPFPWLKECDNSGLMESLVALENTKLNLEVLKGCLKSFSFSAQQLKVVNASRIMKLWEVKGKTIKIISDTELKKSSIAGMKQTLKCLSSLKHNK